MSRRAKKRPELESGEQFEFKRRLFKVEIEQDNDLREPWKEHDGHGVVSAWTSRPKKPGEVVLVKSDRGSSCLYYDWQETTKRARAEGWGLGPAELEKLTKQLGRVPSKGQVRAAAVQADYDRLRGWCLGHWCWVGVVVVRLRRNKAARGGVFEAEKTSLWGIESDCREYLTEVAYELAADLISQGGR